MPPSSNRSGFPTVIKCTVMKRFLLSSVVVLLSLFRGYADPVLAAFSARAASSCVSFDYSFSVGGSGSAKVYGKGTAEVSGDAFKVSGNGLEIACDGDSRWISDAEAGEVVIEAVGPGNMDFVTNPALLVSCPEDKFEEVSSDFADFGGKKCRRVALRPKVRTGIKGIVMYFSGDVPAGAEVTSSDGTVTVFTISGIKFSGLKPASSYRPAGFPSDWVVTDMR